MAWILPAFDATRFTASPTGLWIVASGDQITLEYRIVDTDTMVLNWIIGNTNVSGSPISLDFAIPGGYAAVSRVESVQYWEENGRGKFVGWFDINPHDSSCGTRVRHYKLADNHGPVPWANTNNRDCSVHGSIVFQVRQDQSN